MNRRCIAIVPIKDHSERVPGKNFRSFDGRPLFTRVLAMLGRIAGIDRIVVDTDSDRVMAAIAEMDDRYLAVQREPSLCGDDVSVNAIIGSVLDRVETDLAIQTHVTNPLLTERTLRAAIHRYLEAEEHEAVDSLFSVTRIQSRLYDAAGAPINHHPGELLRTQDLPPVYDENSLFYIFTANGFRRTGTRIGQRPELFETPPIESVDIDEEYNFRVAELLALYGSAT